MAIVEDHALRSCPRQDVVKFDQDRRLIVVGSSLRMNNDPYRNVKGVGFEVSGNRVVVE